MGTTITCYQRLPKVKVIQIIFLGCGSLQELGTLSYHFESGILITHLLPDILHISMQKSNVFLLAQTTCICYFINARPSILYWLLVFSRFSMELSGYYIEHVQFAHGYTNGAPKVQTKGWNQCWNQRLKPKVENKGAPRVHQGLSRLTLCH